MFTILRLIVYLIKFWTRQMVFKLLVNDRIELLDKFEDASFENRIKVIALENYRAQGKDQLNFTKGQVIEVLDKYFSLFGTNIKPTSRMVVG